MGKLHFAHLRVFWPLYIFTRGIPQISWRRFRTRIMINTCSAKPHTSLVLHPSYIISARPDECFQLCHICETAMSKIVICTLFKANLYDSFLVTNSGWNIHRMLDKQIFVYTNHPKERTHNLTQFDKYSWLFFGNERCLSRSINLKILITLNRVLIVIMWII